MELNNLWKHLRQCEKSPLREVKKKQKTHVLGRPSGC